MTDRELGDVFEHAAPKSPFREKYLELWKAESKLLYHPHKLSKLVQRPKPLWYQSGSVYAGTSILFFILPLLHCGVILYRTYSCMS